MNFAGVRPFIVLANQHMRSELNDLARRLDEQAAASGIARLDCLGACGQQRIPDWSGRCRTSGTQSIRSSPWLQGDLSGEGAAQARGKDRMSRETLDDQLRRELDLENRIHEAIGYAEAIISKRVKLAGRSSDRVCDGSALVPRQPCHVDCRA